MKDWIDRVNTEDHINVATAIESGLAVPDVRFLRTMSCDQQQEILNDPSWIPLPSGMLIERIDGPECTFHAYKNGDIIDCHVVSVNDGNLMNGGMGPDVDDNCLTIWSGMSGQMSHVIEKLFSMADKHVDYTGFVNVGVVFGGNVPHYRYISYGTTYKFAVTLAVLYDGDVKNFFTPEYAAHRARMVPGFGASMRVWGWPYTLETNKTVQCNGEWDGESFFVSGYGDNIKGAWGNIYSQLDGISGACFRTDGSTKARQVFNELMRGRHVEKYEMDRDGDYIRSSSVRGWIPDQALHDEAGNKNREENGSEIQNDIPGLHRAG